MIKTTEQELIDHFDGLYKSYTISLWKERRNKPHLASYWMKYAKQYRRLRDYVAMWVNQDESHPDYPEGWCKVAPRNRVMTYMAKHSENNDNRRYLRKQLAKDYPTLKKSTVYDNQD